MSRKSPAYDSQRSEVYKMEGRGLRGLNVSHYRRHQHAELLKMLSKAFGVDVPQLRYTRDTKYAGMYLAGKGISLSLAYESGTSPMTLVHEFTHHVMHHWDQDAWLEDHGPEFTGVYGDALGMAGLIPWNGWQDLCAQHKVKCLSTSQIRTVAGLRRLVKKRAAEAARRSPPSKR
jgi:hypothetical protein